MQMEFIKDLDEYFCEAYANYDSICLLPGYVMPKMQEMKKDEFGDYVAYTLPSNTMRLALQEKKEDILKAFKAKIVDKEFSFTFSSLSLMGRIANFFSKKAPNKKLAAALRQAGVTAEEAGKSLEIDEKIWKKILSGGYLPTKNLILSLALTQNMDYATTKDLLAAIGAGFDYEKSRDTVIAYLLMKKIANPEMQKAALDEYHIENLFIKWGEEA